MSDLYEADVLAWSERQAGLLRRLGAGEQVNDQVDWENVAEEIESVGRSQLSVVRSKLVRALAHMLKCEAWPLSREVPHWRAEAVRFRQEAREAYAPSMRQRLDVARMYELALRQLPETIDDQPPLPVPEACPVTLDELLGDE
jgi:Domain of unknown function DUF29